MEESTKDFGKMEIDTVKENFTIPNDTSGKKEFG